LFCQDWCIRFHLHKSRYFHRQKKQHPPRFTQPERMLLSDSMLNNDLDSEFEKHRPSADELISGTLSADDDFVMEQILENMNSTPLGQVLKKIASLQKVRRQKVLTVRRQLTDGQYDINSRLDVVLDKVLEKLIQ